MKNYSILICDEDGHIQVEDKVGDIAKKLVRAEKYKGVKTRIKENKVINREFGFRSFIIDNAIDGLLTDKRITAFDFALLFYMISKMEFGNLCYLTYNDIVEKFSTHKSTVSKSIKRLETAKCISIIKEKGVTSRTYYRVSPLIAYKGKYEDWKKEMFDNNQSLAIEVEII
jgi:predicted transcriptional regulator